jgi:hypothetical protein
MDKLQIVISLTALIVVVVIMFFIIAMFSVINWVFGFGIDHNTIVLAASCYSVGSYFLNGTDERD